MPQRPLNDDSSVSHFNEAEENFKLIPCSSRAITSNEC